MTGIRRYLACRRRLPPMTTRHDAGRTTLVTLHVLRVKAFGVRRRTRLKIMNLYVEPPSL